MRIPARGSPPLTAVAGGPPPPMSRPLFRPDRAQMTLAALALAALVAAACGFAIQRWRRDLVVPGADSLSAAARVLEKDLRIGDAVSVLPAWSAAQRWRFERAVRDRGLDAERAILLGDPVESWDLDGFRRLWLVTTHGHADRAQIAGLPPPAREQDLGEGTQLFLFEVPSSQTIYDFRERLADASVERVDERGKASRCPWRDGRHDCSGPWWRDVFAAIHEVGNSRRPCIFVQAWPDGGAVRVAWRDLPGASLLTGRFGLRLWAVRYDEGSDVRFRVRIGGRLALELKVERGDFRYQPWQVALEKGDAGKPITFEVAAADVRWRQACFDARLTGAKADAEAAAGDTDPAGVGAEQAP